MEGTVASGNIAGDGSLVLKLYYTRNSYDVTYAYTGTVPTGASALPEKATVKYGASVTVAAGTPRPRAIRSAAGAGMTSQCRPKT